MLDTFKNSFKLKNTYTANSFIFSFKQLPFIRRLVPAYLYNIKGVKIFANIMSILLEIFLIFVLKPLYVYLFISSFAHAYGTGSSNNFIHIFFFLTINGLFMKTDFLSPSKDKFYAIILMRMDAKKYALSEFIYSLAASFLGTLPAYLYFGIKIGISPFLCVIMPLFVITLKISYIAFILSYSEKTGKRFLGGSIPWPFWILVFGNLILAYAPVFFGFAIPPICLIIAFAISIVTCIFAVRYLFKFDRYHIVFKNLLNAKNVIFEFNQDGEASTHSSISKDLESKKAVASKKQGYALFHEIFVKRHRKILTKSAKRTAEIFAAVLAVLIAAALLSEQISDQINAGILQYLSLFVLIMYFVNRGQMITNAMFMNCDHSMLVYRFYRQPKAILELFSLRLKTMITINLIPSSVIAIGLPLMLYISGGTDNPLNYVILFATIISLSIFFSVHHLVIYYLLQPYNVELKPKSGLYRIASMGTYFACFYIAKIHMSTFAFGLSVIGFTVLYVIVALILAYKFAPKTFRLR
ncbi:MAG: hypothetical protein RR355_00045 [Oscillospiraceae bacterium]